MVSVDRSLSLILPNTTRRQALPVSPCKPGPACCSIRVARVHSPWILLRAFVSALGQDGHYLGSSTSGSPFFEFPIITILEFGLTASFSVASIPFHSSNCGLIPCATIF